MKRALLVLLLVCPFCVLLGCAVGRNEGTGEIVLGIEAGRLVETTQQGIAALGDYFLPGLGGAVGLLGTAGIGWARSHAKRKQLEGREEGWDGAEEAMVYQPVGAPVRRPVASAVPVVPEPAPAPETPIKE